MLVHVCACSCMLLGASSESVAVFSTATCIANVLTQMFSCSYREIGSIVRSLGCFPTEAELQELLAKVKVLDLFCTLLS